MYLSFNPVSQPVAKDSVFDEIYGVGEEWTVKVESLAPGLVDEIKKLPWWVWAVLAYALLRRR